MTTTAIKLESPATLSRKLLAIARDYLDARRRSGESFLAAARYLAEARAAAKHGEWQNFLAATNTTPDVAESLLRIADEADRDSRFADAVRTNFLSPTVAALLTRESTPDAARERLLSAETPPTVNEARQIIQEEQPPIIRIDTENDPLPALGQASGLADIFYRLDVHGHSKTGQRQKGMTTFYTFLDHGTGEERELAEGELSYWLSDLDASAARRATTQAQYEDASARFTSLGWRLDRTHADNKLAYSLFDPNNKHYATTEQLHPQIATLKRFESSTAARRPTTTTTAPAVTENIPHLPPPAEWKAAKERASVLGLRLDMHASGAFSFYRLSDQSAAGGAVDWAAALDLLARKEVAHFTALCERAEKLGATIGYLHNGDPSIVQVIPPKGYQQAPLRCDAADLTRLIAAWEGTAQPSAHGATLHRANLYRHWRAAEEALDQADRDAAKRAILSMFRAVHGPCTVVVLPPEAVDVDALARSIRAFAAGVHPDRVEPGLSVLRAVLAKLESEATP